MKLERVTAFVLFFGIMAASAAGGQENISLTEERKRTLQFGIDSEIEPLLDQLADEKDEAFIQEISALFEQSRTTKIRTACLEYLTSVESDAALDQAEEIMLGYEDHPLSLVKGVIDYISSIRDAIELKKIGPLLEGEAAIAAAAIRKFSTLEVEGFTEVLKKKYDDRNTDTSLRAEILLAFGNLKDKSTIQMLETIARDEGEEATLRHYACSALGEIGDPESLPVLIGVYTSDDALTRSYALYGISKIDGPKASEIVLSALRDSYWKIRVYACEALGEKKMKEAVPALQYKAEKDPELPVRSAAVTALAKIGGNEALETLYKLFETDLTNAALRITAFNGLAEHHFPAALEKIREVFEQELAKDRSSILDTICKTLSMKEAPNLTDFYKKMLDHGSLTVKIHALRGIATNSVQQLKSEVEKLAGEEMPGSIRKHALQALESL